ncbi:MAG: sulfotransferase [Cyclobacteriaceae bacterium]
MVRLFYRRKKIKLGESEGYFFIIGSGRCGSTLLRVMLERHSRITIVPEISMALPKSCDFYINQKSLSSKAYFNKFFDMYSSQHAWNTDIFQEEEIRLKYESEEEPAFPAFLKTIYAQYKAKMKPNADLIGDKNPYLTFHLPYLHYVFPRAKFIHLIRDGRDVSSSWANTKELKMNLIDAAKRWNWALKEVERFGFLLRGRILELRYEDLVSNPKDTLSKVCQFLGVQFETELLNESVNNSSDEVAQGHHESSVKKVGTHSIGNWKRNLTESQILEIEPILIRRLKKYGYL